MKNPKKTIHLIAAARPNFMKIAPLCHALEARDWADPAIVHTGQHYDFNMSDSFFADLNITAPRYHLGIGSGTHAEQTGQVMIKYEKVLLERRPDIVVVVGDVNSTVAATLAAVKLGIKVAHLEAGLRSFDRAMPEEINRVVTDSIADLLWTPSPDANENLEREGIPAHRIKRVGNIMIDSLENMRGKIEDAGTFRNFKLSPGGYGIVTIHRPSNVDNPAELERICRMVAEVSKKIGLIFPVHPRTRKAIEQQSLLALLEKAKGLILTTPQTYINFMSLMFSSALVITDSGGIQEETTYLGVPCLTMRQNTERPITVTHGTNRLCDVADVPGLVDAILSGARRPAQKIDLWDGKTAERVVENLRSHLF